MHTTNKTFRKVDLDMYGVIDIEALADQVDALVAENKNSLAHILLDMLSELSEDIELNPGQARQTANRAKFLILRCCPLLHPERDPNTDELDLTTGPGGCLLGGAPFAKSSATEGVSP